MTIKILALEDDPDDLFFLRELLRPTLAAEFEVESARTLGAGLNRLEAGGIDLIMLDLVLPDSSGLITFEAVKSAAKGVPIIILSGYDDDAIAIKAVHSGAEDYLVKGRVDRALMTRAILYAIERAEAKKAIFDAEEKFRGIFENSVSGIFQTSPEGTYLSVNPALARIYGYESTAELMSGLTDIARKLYVDPNRRSEFIQLMQETGVVQNFESQIHRKDGSIIWISENARAVRDRTCKLVYYEGMVEDITARRMAEDKLRSSEDRFRSVWESSIDGMRLTDARGTVLAVNRSFCRIVAMPEEELVGQPFTAIYSAEEDLTAMLGRFVERFQARRLEERNERRVTFRSLKTVDLEITHAFVEAEGGEAQLLSVFRDVSVRKQAMERERLANAELARSQAELRRQNEIMQDDLRMAHEIQQAMFPQQYPTFPAGAKPEASLLKFCHRYYATGEVGGDFYNVLALADNKAGLFICDVMGHGVRSALVTAMVRALVEELRPIALDPGELLARLNSDLRSILQQSRTPLYTTAFYLVADLEKNELAYANAGHPRPFLVRRQEGGVELLRNEDGKSYAALGLFPKIAYPTTRRPLLAGDKVMLFTDGLYEVEGRNDELYSQEMLLAAVRRHAQRPCAEMFDAVLAEVRQFSDNKPFVDDVCLVGMEVAQPPAT